MQESERPSILETVTEDFKLIFVAIWLGIKTALSLGIPLLIAWFSIPLFQHVGPSLQGTTIELFLPLLLFLIWGLGAPSVGALLFWALWGINPFKGVELKPLDNASQRT